MAGLRCVHRVGLTKFSSLTWLPVLKRGEKSRLEQLKHVHCRQKSYRRKRKYKSLLKDEGIFPFERLLSNQSSFLNSVNVHNRRNPDRARRKIRTTKRPFELT